jgi:hypothetical protein
MYETVEEFQGRLKVFNDSLPKEEPVPRGNCMNQEFYTREILPLYIKEIKALQKRHKRRYRLQEDGDPSHGNGSQNNPPARLKRDADLLILVHPP